MHYCFCKRSYFLYRHFLLLNHFHFLPIACKSTGHDPPVVRCINFHLLNFSEENHFNFSNLLTITHGKHIEFERFFFNYAMQSAGNAHAFIYQKCKNVL